MASCKRWLGWAVGRAHKPSTTAGRSLAAPNCLASRWGTVVFLKLCDGALDLHGTATGSSCAYGINEAGVVVGQRSDTVNSEYVQRAVVYFPEVGVMQDLQDLLVRSQRGQWVLTTAVAINVDGKIIGRGHRLDDPTRLQAVLLTPVR
jgi:hypothetical protein